MNYLHVEYEGVHTYLVYSMSQQDQIDLGLYNKMNKNALDGIMPVKIIEKEDYFCCQYDITAKLSLEQIISTSVTKTDFLTIIASITRALILGKELDFRMENFYMMPAYIYVNVSTKEAELVYLPMKETGKKTDLVHFYKNLLFRAQYDANEDTGYVVNIINYLNQKEDFTIEGFLNLIEDELISTAETKNKESNEEPCMNKAQEEASKKCSFFRLFGQAVERLVGTGTMF